MQPMIATLHTGRKVFYGGLIPTPPEHRKLQARWLGKELLGLPPLPTTNINNISKVLAWDIYFNDQTGTCVPAERGRCEARHHDGDRAPEVDIPDANFEAWSKALGILERGHAAQTF